MQAVVFVCFLSRFFFCTTQALNSGGGRDAEWAQLSPFVSMIDAANTGEKSPFLFCMFTGCEACCDSPDLHKQSGWLGQHLKASHETAFAAINRCFEHVVSCDPNADSCAGCASTVDLTCCVDCYDACCPQCVAGMDLAD